MIKEETMHWREYNKKVILSKYLSILVGNFLCAMALILFLRPGQMIGGGVGGISVLLNTVFGIPLGVSVLLFNLPLMVLSLKVLDRNFILYSTLSMFIFSLYMSLFDFLASYIHITDDVLLSCVFGSILNGAGMGIMFRNGTCQGGLDVVAALTKKLYGINISKVLLGVNGVIITISGFVFSFNRAMYTLIGLFIAYQVLDRIQMGVGQMKQIFIMTNMSKPIARSIMKELHRGVTYLKGTGAYSHQDMDIIYCIVDNHEFVQVRKIVDSIDPEAFMTISETVEVKGRGFSHIQV
ncbi:transporter [Tissierellia bacterium S5-A11]|nr:transporter [Tissierellia bacterium S5-A11]